MSAVQRLNVQKIDPAAYKAVLAMEGYIHSGTLGEDLINLVKIRASQLNGCAFCLDMHTREATSQGESLRRIAVLSAWREAPDLYTDKERAAVALTESVTQISHAGVPDEVWDQARANFNEPELVQLLMAISTINVWNRLAVSTHQSLPDAG